MVLHVDWTQGLAWSDAEVMERWHLLLKGSLLSQRFSRGEALDWAEQQALAEEVTDWHQRPVSTSWFMRCLNEPIAREANREDNVTGRFWESRYSSQQPFMDTHISIDTSLSNPSPFLDPFDLNHSVSIHDVKRTR